MKGQPKVSVIVAVYNAEKTLPRCLDSLAAQTLQDVEFLCINDGSTDHSAEILDSFAVADKRFQVFHKANEGVSATRQFGLNHVRGEYVIHLDADDYVDKTAYEHLYDTAQTLNADIVICDALQITDTGTERMDYSAKDCSASTWIRRMLTWETSALWNRLIKTELISRYDLHFPPYLQLAEDRYFLTCLLCRSLKRGDALRITHLAEALVHYDKTANPASLSKFSSMKDSFASIMNSLGILLDEIDTEQFGNELYSLILGLAFNAFWSFGKYDLSEEDFLTIFGPYGEGIKRYTPPKYTKTLVLLAIHRGIRFANLFKWIAVPTIFCDKIRAHFECQKRDGLPCNQSNRA